MSFKRRDSKENDLKNTLQCPERYGKRKRRFLDKNDSQFTFTNRCFVLVSPGWVENIGRTDSKLLSNSKRFSDQR